MRYQLQRAIYEHLPSNDFKDIKTGEIIDIFDERHKKLMQRVEVGLHSGVTGNKRRTLYDKIAQLKRPKKPKPEPPEKKEPLKYVVVGNVVIFDRKTRIHIGNKTVEEIVEKYQNIIYGKLE